VSADDGRTVRAGRRTVGVHRPDKVLIPGGDTAKDVTKTERVAPHWSPATYMLPHLRGRPLMPARYADGPDDWTCRRPSGPPAPADCTPWCR
jgi:bifunctional non-homologous end joining protein LigD